MPTLWLSRRVRLQADDPLDGPGCHAVLEARPGVSRGWLASLPDGGPRRLLEPARAVYHPGAGMTLRVFTDLEPGAYEAHSVLCPERRRAHRILFAVEGGRIAIVSPATGKSEQLALFDPNRAEAG